MSGAPGGGGPIHIAGRRFEKDVGIEFPNAPPEGPGAAETPNPMARRPASPEFLARTARALAPVPELVADVDEAYAARRRSLRMMADPAMGSRVAASIAERRRVDAAVEAERLARATMAAGPAAQPEPPAPGLLPPMPTADQPATEGGGEPSMLSGLLERLGVGLREGAGAMVRGALEAGEQLATSASRLEGLTSDLLPRVAEALGVDPDVAETLDLGRAAGRAAGALGAVQGKIPEPESVYGRFVEEGTRAAAGALPFNRAAQALGVTSSFVRWTFIGGPASDFFAYDPDDPLAGQFIADWMKGLGEAADPVMETVRATVADALGRDEDDTEFEKRLSSVLEGVVTGALFDGAIKIGTSAFRMMKRAVADPAGVLEPIARAGREAAERVTSREAGELVEMHAGLPAADPMDRVLAGLGRAAEAARRPAALRAELAAQAAPLERVRNTQLGRMVETFQDMPAERAVRVLADQLNQLAREGAGGRYWYERSGQALLALTGGDVKRADKLAQLIAIYSPQAPINQNLGFALRAWNRFAEGRPLWEGEEIARFADEVIETFDDVAMARREARARGGAKAGVEVRPAADGRGHEVVKSGRAEAERLSKRYAGRRGGVFVEEAGPGEYVVARTAEGYANIKTAPQDYAAHRLLYDDVPFAGRKVNNFYVNMSRAWSDQPQGVTADVWMGRAFGFVGDNVGMRGKYDLIEGVTGQLARELGWEPQQVQAAIWVATKARFDAVRGEVWREAAERGFIKPKGANVLKDYDLVDETGLMTLWRERAMGRGIDPEALAAGVRDFADYMPANMGQVSMETTPGATTGFMPELLAAPPQEQLRHHVAQMQALQDEAGRDIIARDLGLLTPGSVEGPGWWGGRSHPSQQMPVVALRPKGVKAQAAAIDPDDQARIELYAAMRGLIHKQEAVGWHKPYVGGPKARRNLLLVDLFDDAGGAPRVIRDAEMTDVGQEIGRQLMARGKDPEGVALIAAPEGLRVLNFTDLSIDDLDDIVGTALERHIKDGTYKAASGGSVGNLVSNDWGSAPNAETYIDAIYDRGGPEALRRVRDVYLRSSGLVDLETAYRNRWDAGPVIERNEAIRRAIDARLARAGGDAGGAGAPGAAVQKAVDVGGSAAGGAEAAGAGALAGAPLPPQGEDLFRIVSEGELRRQRARAIDPGLVAGAGGGAGDPLRSPRGVGAVDPEGRPLSARFIAGIREEGGADVALSDREIYEVAAALAQRVELANRGQLGGALGQVVTEPGGALRLQVYSELEPAEMRATFAHETGHVVEKSTALRMAVADIWKNKRPAGMDREAWNARITELARGLNEELEEVSALRRPVLWRSAEEMAAAGIAPDRIEFLRGYRVQPDELWADAVAAYLDDPKGMKEAFPLLSEFMRSIVNENPRTAEVIQLAGAAAVPLSFAPLLDAVHERVEAEMPQQPTGEPNVVDPTGEPQRMGIAGELLGALSRLMGKQPAPRVGEIVPGAPRASTAAPGAGVGTSGPRGASGAADVGTSGPRGAAPPTPRLEPLDLGTMATAMGRDPYRAYRGPAPSGGIDFNFDNIRAEEDVLRQIDDVSRGFAPTIDEAKRGIRGHEATKQVADLLGMGEAALARRRGELWNAEQMLAARRLLVASAERTDELAQAAIGGGPEALLAFRRQLALHAQIQANVKGAQTEIARALNQFNIPVSTTAHARGQVDTLRDRMAGEMLDRLGGEAQTRRLAEAFLSVRDPIGKNAIARKGWAAKTRDAVYEAWINGILSGPTTHAVNMAGNTLFTGWLVAERALSGRPGEAGAMLFGMMHGFEDLAHLTALALRGRLGDEGAAGAAGALRERLAASGVLDDPASKIEDVTRDAISAQALEASGTLGKMVDWLGTAIRVPGTMLEAEDTFFKTLAYRAEVYAQAYRLASEAYRQGGSEREALEVLRVAALTPPAEVNMRAVDFARLATFTNDLGDTGRATMRVLNRVPFARVVVPFIRTPTNILKAAAGRTPLAALQLLSPQRRREILTNPEARDAFTAKLTMGSMLMATAAYLAEQGMVTGSGPSDPGERASWLEGNQPYSIRVGDQWVSYGRFEPLALIFGLAADVADFAKYSDDEASVMELANAAVAAVSENLKDKTWISGPVEAIEAINDWERHGARYLERLAGGAVPYSSMIRSVERAVDPELREPRIGYAGDALGREMGEGERFVRRLLNTYKAQTPGLSDDLPPRRNVWGEPIKLGAGGLEAMVSPIYRKRAEWSPIDEKLVELGAPIEVPGWELGGVELSAAERDDLIRLQGQGVKLRVRQLAPAGGGLAFRELRQERALNELVQTEYFRELPPEMQTDLIRDVHREYLWGDYDQRSGTGSYGAVYELLRGHPDLRRRLREAQTERAAAGARAAAVMGGAR